MDKIELRLFVQSNCPKCPPVKAVANELIKRRNDVELKVLDIGDHENYLSALMLQISSTPAFAVGERTFYFSYTPTVDELIRKVDQHAKIG